MNDSITASLPAINPRLREVMDRIGSRPALIHMQFAGDSYPESKPYEIKDGIALVDIVGPLSNAAWSWRGTTYGDIQEQMKMAAADPDVKGILLYVNSPGGETDNAFETAKVIREAAAEKPCYAVASTIAYSAAYLLASQAGQIYCSPISGGVGSIGVYCAHMDMSEMLKEMGVKITLISAGKGKTDGNPYEPLSASAKAQMQEEIDRLYGEFISAVSTGRDMRESEVVKLGARLYEGQERAIASGLADRPGDLNVAFQDLYAETQRQEMPMPPVMPMRQASSVAPATKSQKGETQMAEENQPAAAEATETASVDVEALVAEARNEGYAEASVIVDLCAIAGVPPAKAVEYIGQKKTAAQVRADLLKAKVDAQTATAVDTAVMPGADAQDSESGNAPEGKAKPWSEIMASLDFRKKKGGK